MQLPQPLPFPRACCRQTTTPPPNPPAAISPNSCRRPSSARIPRPSRRRRPLRRFPNFARGEVVAPAAGSRRQPSSDPRAIRSRPQPSVRLRGPAGIGAALATLSPGANLHRNRRLSRRRLDRGHVDKIIDGGARPGSYGKSSAMAARAARRQPKGEICDELLKVVLEEMCVAGG